jgi:hypothetical protein
MIHTFEYRWMREKKNSNSQEKAKMSFTKLPIHWSIRGSQRNPLGTTCQKMVARECDIFATDRTVAIVNTSRVVCVSVSIEVMSPVKRTSVFRLEFDFGWPAKALWILSELIMWIRMNCCEVEF